MDLNTFKENVEKMDEVSKDNLIITLIEIVIGMTLSPIKSYNEFICILIYKHILQLNKMIYGADGLEALQLADDEIEKYFVSNDIEQPDSKDS